MLKLTSDFFSPAFFAYCALYLLSLLCALLYTLYGKIRNVWTESKKTCLRFFFKFGPRWPKRTHYKLFMSTDDKYTSISKSVLIENYLLIEYFCEFFFLNSCENLQIRPQINSWSNKISFSLDLITACSAGTYTNTYRKHFEKILCKADFSGIHLKLMDDICKSVIFFLQGKYEFIWMINISVSFQ